MSNQPTNGDRYITWKDWHDLENEIISIIKSTGKEQSNAIASIVGQLNIMNEAERVCRAEVQPVIKSYNTVKKLAYALIISNAGIIAASGLPQWVTELLSKMFGG
jgi:thiosulfate reductase cytochrome b subunit